MMRGTWKSARDSGVEAVADITSVGIEHTDLSAYAPPIAEPTPLLRALRTT